MGFPVLFRYSVFLLPLFPIFSEILLGFRGGDIQPGLQPIYDLLKSVYYCFTFLARLADAKSGAGKEAVEAFCHFFTLYSLDYMFYF